jgi:drug/metabolite transporter (DMT)-like permease
VTQTAANPPSRPLGAALWMLGAVASFSAMAVAGREAAHELDTFEIMIYRSALGLVIILAVVFFTGQGHRLSTARLPLHFLRNLFHFAGQNFWFLALSLIPLAQVFALEFSYPIIVALLSPMLLGERMSRSRLTATALGFIGILIVTRPSASSLSLGTVCALLAAVGFAGSAIATKVLTRTQAVINILFWLTVMQGVMGLVCAGLDGDIALPSLRIVPMLVVLGIAGLAGHLCLTMALSLAPAAVVTPMDFARLPVIALVGAIFYSESIDPFVIAGGSVIFAANYLNVRAEAARSGKAISQRQ